MNQDERFLQFIEKFNYKQAYCGCCGTEIQGDLMWCLKCRSHILGTEDAPWDRTYQAQHDKPCPFQV